MTRPDFREFQGQGVNELLHYGMPRRSGRYPYGSGDRPYQSSGGRTNTDTLRIRSLDKKINKVSRSNSKNREKRLSQLNERRDQLVKRDKDTNSENLVIRKKAQIDRARDNSHVYTNVRGNINIAASGAVAISGILSGSVGSIVVGSAYIGYSAFSKKIRNVAIDKVADILISKVDKNELKHSAKGSTWEDHKYVKKIDGVYYYPVGYEDGRTIDELTSKNKDTEKKKEDSKSTEEKVDQVKHHFDEYLKERGIDWRTLPKEEVDAVQRTIVRLLESGESDSIEELISKLKPEEPKKKPSSSKSEKTEEQVEKKEEEEKKKRKKTVTSSTKKKVDMNKVWAVYHNKNGVEIKRRG